MEESVGKITLRPSCMARPGWSKLMCVARERMKSSESRAGKYLSRIDVSVKQSW